MKKSDNKNDAPIDKNQPGIFTPSEIVPIVNGKLPVSSRIKITGMIVTVRKIETKKGLLMAKFEFKDLSASINVCVFPKAYKKFSKLLIDGKTVGVCGTVNCSEFRGVISYELFADEIMDI